MKTSKILKITMICLVLASILFVENVYAKENQEGEFRIIEYSEEYQKWMSLSDEEKAKTMAPRMYNIKNSQTNSDNTKNILRISKLLKATANDRFSLQDEIAENVNIRNQKQTNTCWAFATLGALETSLALRDKLESRPVTVYDYSERHMDYATARNVFLDDKINEKGFTRDIKNGGSFLMANAYLTNGSGAIAEEELKFENNQDKIDISDIQNKEVITTLIDANQFSVPANDSEKQELITKMKEHITNYGGIAATIKGAEIISDYYNNLTGAIYCKNAILTPADHAVTIIGWDDNYEISNFNEKNLPTKKGAWIVKNSWGESVEQNLAELKTQFYNQNMDLCNSKQWDSAEKITDEFMIETVEKQGYGKGKVTVKGENISIEIGDKGIMYISYDDANVYSGLYGIEKASSTKDYYNLYQNDILGMSALAGTTSNEKLYIANVFNRDKSIKEVLDKVSIYTNEPYTCKVYVNPKGSEKTLNDLKEVELAAGDSESFDAGYHTIEFAKPVELTGDTFTVVIEVLNGAKTLALESKIESMGYGDAVVNPGESFVTTETALQSGNWQDATTIEGQDFTGGNTCIKAFTKEKTGGSYSKEPVSSNFDNAKAELIEAELYFETGNLENIDGKIRIKVSNIQIGDENNNYTYYYYLSGTQGDTNIPSSAWKEATIQQESDGTYSIIFDITLAELEEYDSLAEAENVFLYIKEIAEVNNNITETITTLEVENNAEIAFYVDGEKIEIDSLDEILERIEYTGPYYDDSTTATRILPQTGTISLIIALCAIVVIGGGYSYYRYKNIDR